ncbi:MAG: HipA N-terminal domain-containing protein [Candidatus Symbiothrix sp.]|jgi:serine/threonine-protein kinase HipA|nr:HipA N-terminal domain-containing protein [Candidatus Symbiothrix sp.]
MKQAQVYMNKLLAGTLRKQDDGTYLFRYNDVYFVNPDLSAISLTLPKTKQEYHSSVLFPFFFNMLSEGVNKQVQLRQFKLDEDDYFGLLLATAGNDTIGAITVKELKEA